MDALPANYLCSRNRDRMRTKGISLEAKTPSDRNTSFLIARRNRFRVDGVSLENVYSSILSLLLSVPAVPTAALSTSIIAETLVIIEGAFEVPAAPTVSISTSILEPP